MRYLAVVAMLVAGGCDGRALGPVDRNLVAVGDFKIEQDPRPVLLPYSAADIECHNDGLALPATTQWTQALQAGAIAIFPGDVEWLDNEYSANFNQTQPLETIIGKPGDVTPTRPSLFRCVLDS